MTFHMTYEIFLVFHDFSRPGNTFFKFHDFSRFSMTARTLSLWNTSKTSNPIRLGADVLHVTETLLLGPPPPLPQLRLCVSCTLYTLTVSDTLTLLTHAVHLYVQSVMYSGDDSDYLQYIGQIELELM